MEDHIHLVVRDLITKTHNFLIELHNPALTNGPGTQDLTLTTGLHEIVLLVINLHDIWCGYK